MTSICIFAGTTEGRKLCEYLSDQAVDVTACVISEYGKALLPKAANIHVIEKSMDEEEIKRLLEKEGFDLVIDATHPYAKEATANIKSACSKTNTEYIRVLRSESPEVEGIVYKENAGDAVEFLSGQKGNILITTGSKELQDLKDISGFSERAYVRVLPLEESLWLCDAADVTPSHIYAMQGPFSYEMNLAMIRACDAKWLVSKESGSAGGFVAKLDAVKTAGINMLVLGRPVKEIGISLDEAVQFLSDMYGLDIKAASDSGKNYVNIIGIGPGDTDHLTVRAAELIKRAGLIIGADRMLGLAKTLGCSCPMISTTVAGKVVEAVYANRDHNNICILMSGDSGFYSGAKKLISLLDGLDIRIEPGISSLSYFASRLGIPYDDICPVSSHGRVVDISAALKEHKKLFVLVGGNTGAKDAISELVVMGYQNVWVCVGERLGYIDEKISAGRALEMKDRDYDPLSVLIIFDSEEEAKWGSGSLTVHSQR